MSRCNTLIEPADKSVLIDYSKKNERFKVNFCFTNTLNVGRILFSSYGGLK